MKLPISERAKVTCAVHTPADDTAAVVTIAAVEGEVWCIKGIQYSYDDTPTGGLLTVVAGSTTLLAIDIAAAGYTDVALPAEGLSRHVENETYTVTLAAGGAGIGGNLNVQYA